MNESYTPCQHSAVIASLALRLESAGRRRPRLRRQRPSLSERKGRRETDSPPHARRALSLSLSLSRSLTSSAHKHTRPSPHATPTHARTPPSRHAHRYHGHKPQARSGEWGRTRPKRHVPTPTAQGARIFTARIFTARSGRTRRRCRRSLTRRRRSAPTRQRRMWTPVPCT